MIHAVGILIEKKNKKKKIIFWWAARLEDYKKGVMGVY
jgi:hypothetical protein